MKLWIDLFQFLITKLGSDPLHGQTQGQFLTHIVCEIDNASIRLKPPDINLGKIFPFLISRQFCIKLVHHVNDPVDPFLKLFERTIANQRSYSRYIRMHVEPLADATDFSVQVDHIAKLRRMVRQVIDRNSRRKGPATTIQARDQYR